MSPDYIIETAFAFRKAKALLSAVELGLFETLAKCPQNAEQLTVQLGLKGRGARDFSTLSSHSSCSIAMPTVVTSMRPTARCISTQASQPTLVIS
jgi:hypothetical protein